MASIAASDVGGNGEREDITLLRDVQVDLVATLPPRFARRLRSPTGVEAYACVLAAAVIVIGAVLIREGWRLGAPWWIIAALACVAALAERQSVELGETTQMSVSTLPILFGAVAFGPFAGLIIGTSALISDLRRPYTRWVVWTSVGGLIGALPGLVAHLIAENDRSLVWLFAAVAAASATLAVVDTVAIRRSGSFISTTRLFTRLFAFTMPLYTPVLALLVYAYKSFSPWTVLFFFVPAVAAQRLLVLYQQQGRLVQDLAAANHRLEESGLSFASALVAALDARDRYTAGHSAAVAVYARDIAARLGLSEGEQRLAHLCGLLHDIGKVGLPPAILEKTGPLTLAERRQMEEHVLIGEKILANVDQYYEIARIVRHHHERVDGQGYPDRLYGDEIPLLSKIIGVADAYNAMTSGRPYRDAMPSSVARIRLAQAVGTQFDTTVVAAFEAILATASEVYLRGSRADFAIEAQRQRSADFASVAVTA